MTAQVRAERFRPRTPTFPMSDSRWNKAVNAYTQGSSYARFTDDRIGTLAAGKEADLAVLSQDIFLVKPEDIGKARVVITMVGGRVVFAEEK